MNIDLSFNGGTFISSKDKYGYEQVLNDFKNAKKIRIVTYNISNKEDDHLLEAIQSLNSDTDIEIITNIPSRAVTYYKGKKGMAWRNTASANINTYLTKLNPDTFNGPIIPYFNFNNHSKIIGTENKVYIGSENFSVESKKNYEAGILIEDKGFISKLYELFFNNLKDVSVPYFDDDYNQLRLFTISILTRLINHYDYFMDSFFRIRNDGETVFINEETVFTQNNLYELLHDLQELSDIQGLIENITSDEDEVNEALEKMIEIFDDMPISNIVDFLEIDGPIYEYIVFDMQDEILDIFDKEYSGIADDGEKVEYYLEVSSDNANDTFSDLCNDVESDFYSVKIDFEKIIECLNDIISVIKEMSEHAVNPLIDNT